MWLTASNLVCLPNISGEQGTQSSHTPEGERAHDLTLATPHLPCDFIQKSLN